MANADMWDWWLGTLTDEDRDELIETLGEPLRPDFAYGLWLRSGIPVVVEPTHGGYDEPARWYLTADIIDFVGWRRYELQHPEDMH